MKYTYQDFQRLLPNLGWPAEELADKLTVIGFETETDGTTLNVALTSNRKDCADIHFLVFDLAGIYNLKTVADLITYSHGPAIAVTPPEVNKLLGSEITKEDWHALERLGFLVSYEQVSPPDFRDVATKNDVAEEIIRLIGFNRLQIKELTAKPAVASPNYELVNRVRFALTSLGITETLTSSFSPVGERRLKNPFTADEPYLRPNLERGLLQTLARNPYLKRAMFFEIGSTFSPEEEVKIGVITAGYKNNEALEAELSQALGMVIRLVEVDQKNLAEADVKQPRVYFGEFPLSLTKPVSTEEPAVFKQPLKQYQKISKFPPLVRDVTVNGADEPATLISQLYQSFPELLLAEQTDSFTHPETKKVALTFRLIFQNMSTSFSQAEITTIDQKLAKWLSSATPNS